MAQFYVDDADFDIADFTVRIDGGGDCTPAIVDDGGVNVLEVDGTNDQRRMVSWDTPGTPTEVEILVFARRADTDGNGSATGVAGRVAGADETDVSAYRSSVTGTDERIGKYVTGSFTELVDAGSTITDATTYHWNRFRINGSDLKSKRWDGLIGDEPAAWDIETTDPDITAAGWVGIFVFSGTVHRFARIGVGTNGDTAPHEAVSAFDPANLQATVDGSDVTLNWDASF